MEDAGNRFLRRRQQAARLTHRLRFGHARGDRSAFLSEAAAPFSKGVWGTRFCGGSGVRVLRALANLSSIGFRRLSRSPRFRSSRVASAVRWGSMDKATAPGRLPEAVQT